MQEDRNKAAQKQKRVSRKTIKKLKAEVRRKDKALAETTSLLVLSKSSKPCTAKTRTAARTTDAAGRTCKAPGAF